MNTARSVSIRERREQESSLPAILCVPMRPSGQPVVHRVGEPSSLPNDAASRDVACAAGSTRSRVEDRVCRSADAGVREDREGIKGDGRGTSVAGPRRHSSRGSLLPRAFNLRNRATHPTDCYAQLAGALIQTDSRRHRRGEIPSAFKRTSARRRGDVDGSATLREPECHGHRPP